MITLKVCVMRRVAAVAALLWIGFSQCCLYEMTGRQDQLSERMASVTPKPNGDGACARLQSSLSELAGTRQLSQLHWWDEMEDMITETSYGDVEFSEGEEFENWVKTTLFPFYTSERMRRSSVAPLGRETMGSLLSVLHNFDRTGEPLRIYVMGGSVTYGMNSCRNPATGGDISDESSIQCAWPVRLEFMMNRILNKMYGAPMKHGEKRVEIYNLAFPATSSEIGAMTLQYRLFEDVYIDPINKPPHMVLLAYSPNDSFKDMADSRDWMMREIIYAARNLRPCDDVLPAIGYVNDLYFRPDDTTLHEGFVMNGALYTHASWYGMWMVDYAAIARNSVLGSQITEETFDKEDDPLMGMPMDVHMGAGMHIGMAWSVLFNFFQGMIEVCDATEYQHLKRSRQNEESKIRRISESTPRFGVPHEELNPKYLGDVESGMWPYHVNSDYQTKKKRKEKLCKKAKPDRDPACSYAWMVNSAFGIDWPEDLMKAIEPTLSYNDGWIAMGEKVKKPRTGWYAQKEGASFQIVVPKIKIDTMFLTILSMRSYGPKFVDSSLEITVTIEPAASDREPTTDAFTLSGYHTFKSSVHFPDKLQLPTPAERGDTIVLTATLISGSTFKIAGIMLCAE